MHYNEFWISNDRTIVAIHSETHYALELICALIYATGPPV